MPSLGSAASWGLNYGPHHPQAFFAGGQLEPSLLNGGASCLPLQVMWPGFTPASRHWDVMLVFLSWFALFPPCLLSGSVLPYLKISWASPPALLFSLMLRGHVSSPEESFAAP